MSEHANGGALNEEQRDALRTGCSWKLCQNHALKNGLCYDHQPERAPMPVKDTYCSRCGGNEGHLIDCPLVKELSNARAKIAADFPLLTELEVDQKVKEMLDIFKQPSTVQPSEDADSELRKQIQSLRGKTETQPFTVGEMRKLLEGLPDEMETAWQLPPIRARMLADPLYREGQKVWVENKPGECVVLKVEHVVSGTYRYLVERKETFLAPEQFLSARER